MTPLTLAAPFKITKPGFYLMPEPEYRRDPCPAPSLNQSLVKIILDQSVRHAKVAHPKLNPNWEEDDATKYDIGNIAHRLLLGAGKSLKVLFSDLADWRKKEAQALRLAALADGRLAVLSKDYERGATMAKDARAQLLADDELFETFAEGKGHGEVVAVWKEGDTWFRIMLDWLSNDLLTYTDYKTTSASAAPQALPARIDDQGWDVQAAFAERALNALDPANAGRRRFRFVVQENEEPFALTAIEMPESSLHLGRRKVAAAIQLWQRALETGDWPAYPAGVLKISGRDYAEARWLERELFLHEAGLIDFDKDPVLGVDVFPDSKQSATRRDIMRAG